jgi:hypothetical protein
MPSTADPIAALIEESNRLELLGPTVQIGLASPTIKVPVYAVQRVRSEYLGWYGHCLAVLPSDL